jgi:hypothetical protein
MQNVAKNGNRSGKMEKGGRGDISRSVEGK